MSTTTSSGSSGPPLPPSYIDYSNANGILTIVGFVTALALVTVILRIYVRTAILKVVGLDDYLMVLAMLLSLMVLVCYVEETHHGLGKHLIVAVSNPMAFERFLMWNWVHAIVIMVANSTTKISIAFFLMRITARTYYHRFLWGVVVFIVLFTIACFGTLLFQCVPISASWNYSLRPPPLGHGSANCYSLIIFRDIGVFNSSIIMATDVLFASLPIPLIWSLQLNIRQKISLICTLSLGWFSSAASVVKTILQYNFLKDMDWTVHDSFDVWFSIEVNVGILAASLPALKPLLTWMLEPAKRALTGASKNSGLSSKDSSHRSRKTVPTFGDRLRNSRKWTSLGYLKHSSNNEVPMGELRSEPRGRNRSQDYNENNKAGFEVSVTSGEIFFDDGVGTAITSNERRESGRTVSWMNNAARISDDCILPLQRTSDETNRIVKTTEVRLR